MLTPDVDLVIRIILNVFSIVFFIMAYRRIPFSGFIILSVQSLMNLLLRMGILSGVLNDNSLVTNILLLLSNLVNALAAYYLYMSATELTEPKEDVVGDAK